jgi:hypothetical protein
VKDAGGCIDSLVQNSLVVASKPKAQFVVPADTISCPENQFNSFQFVRSLSQSTMDFGDGTPIINSVNPQHIYANVGTYSVKLYVADRYGCSDSIIHVNRIIDTPHASFTVSDSIGLCPPLQVVFNYTGRFAKSVRWYFGDGDISDTIAPATFMVLQELYCHARRNITGDCTIQLINRSGSLVLMGILTLVLREAVYLPQRPSP